jgi:hypothetical protein
MKDINLVNIPLSVIGFLGVFILNGIKNDISEMKNSLKAFETKMYTEITELKERITKVETGCQVRHEDS